MRRPVMLLAAAVALAALGGCGSDSDADPSATGTGPTLAGTSWELATYVASPGAEPADVPDGVRATADFTADRVSGTDGCNAYTGDYTARGEQIRVGALAGTKKACAGDAGQVGAAFGPALRAATTYSVGGETLTLSGAGGTTVLTFTKATPVALVGPTWQATGINNGKQAVQSLVADTEVTATFTDEGTVSGTGGCNRYSGSYQVDGSDLTFGALASTLIGCSEKVSAQESSYLAALDRVSTFVIRGDVLELRDSEGALLVSYSAG